MGFDALAQTAKRRATRAAKPAAEAVAAAVRVADSIVMRAVADLKENPRNSRKHTPAQLARVEASIVRFGFTMPLLVDGADMVIAGHARLDRARKLGIVEVPTIDGSYMTPAEQRAYMIADNQIALTSEWDMEALSAELVELKAGGFDLEVIGFGETLAQFMPAGPPAAPAPGAPPPSGYREQYGVIVICRDEGHQRDVFEKLTAQGYDPRVVVT